MHLSASGNQPVSQAGVIPFRRTADGKLEVLLVSSRSHGWIFPKGHLEPLIAAADMGAIEALEEAGVRGQVEPASLGTWTYAKGGCTYRVAFYDLQVDHVLDTWKEQHRRRRRWCTADKAVQVLPSRDLQKLVKRLARQLENQDVVAIA